MKHQVLITLSLAPFNLNVPSIYHMIATLGRQAQAQSLCSSSALPLSGGFITFHKLTLQGNIG